MTDIVERLRRYRGIMRGGHPSICDEAADLISELRGALEALHVALALYTCHSCPICSGDCSADNPPVMACPTEAAIKAFRLYDAATEQGEVG